ncbi:hypothetical protein M104_0447 [Bacteroides fragilis str. 1007-1-F |uniref:Uncharacterized protein n=1 Tax=Bacteroides fragilis str. 1007-1-F \|nr:hypothetical protein M100_0364 [Bacteroides fragilis str. 1007-1-F \
MQNLHPAGSIYHFFRWLPFTFSAINDCQCSSQSAKGKKWLGRQAMKTE